MMATTTATSSSSLKSSANTVAAAVCGAKKSSSRGAPAFHATTTRRRFVSTIIIIPSTTSSFLIGNFCPALESSFAKDDQGGGAVLTGEYETDTKDIVARMRELLREGTGDVELYIKKYDAYIERYKWDHKGHTNSYASVVSLDQVVRTQYEYAGLTPWEVPPLSSKKGAVLEAYVRNSESCLIKEAYPPFGEMDAATRAEWKAIECSQGLVTPVKE